MVYLIRILIGILILRPLQGGGVLIMGLHQTLPNCQLVAGSRHKRSRWSGLIWPGRVLGVPFRDLLWGLDRGSFRGYTNVEQGPSAFGVRV